MFCGADATSRDADVVATSVLHGYWDLNLFHHLLLLHTSLRDDLGHVHHFLLHEPEPAGTHSLSPSLSLSLSFTRCHALSRAFSAGCLFRPFEGRPMICQLAAWTCQYDLLRTRQLPANQKLWPAKVRDLPQVFNYQRMIVSYIQSYIYIHTRITASKSRSRD